MHNRPWKRKAGKEIEIEKNELIEQQKIQLEKDVAENTGTENFTG